MDKAEEEETKESKEPTQGSDDNATEEQEQIGQEADYEDDLQSPRIVLLPAEQELRDELVRINPNWKKKKSTTSDQGNDNGGELPRQPMNTPVTPRTPLKENAVTSNSQSSDAYLAVGGSQWQDTKFTFETTTTTTTTTTTLATKAEPTTSQCNVATTETTQAAAGHEYEHATEQPTTEIPLVADDRTAIELALSEEFNNIEREFILERFDATKNTLICRYQGQPMNIAAMQFYVPESYPQATPTLQYIKIDLSQDQSTAAQSQLLKIYESRIANSCKTHTVTDLLRILLRVIKDTRTCVKESNDLAV